MPAERKWLTIRERIALAERGILDERMLRHRPTPEERAAMLVDLEQFKAEMDAEREAERQRQLAALDPAAPVPKADHTP